MAPTTKAASPLVAAIHAASEFKLLLDVQPAGTLFNPGGKGDVRTSATYALASRLLGEAAAERLHGAECPGMVHSDVMPVVDVIADHRANMPTDLLELLTGVAVILGKLGFQIPDQNGRGGEQGGTLEIGSGIAGNGNVMIEKIKDKFDAVHKATSEKVVGRTLSHGDAPSPLADSLMKAAFDRPRDPRSDAYKLGVRALLVSRSTKSVFVDRFAPGSVESDAFHAGVDEGRAIWANHQAMASQ